MVKVNENTKLKPISFSDEDLRMVQEQQNLVQALVDKAIREHPGYKLVRTRVVQEGTQYMLHMDFEPDPNVVRYLQRTTQEETDNETDN